MLGSRAPGRRQTIGLGVEDSLPAALSCLLCPSPAQFQGTGGGEGSTAMVGASTMHGAPRVECCPSSPQDAQTPHHS